MAKCRLPLHLKVHNAIATTVMNLRKLALGLVPMIALTSCDENTNPVEVSETRKLTSYDDESNLAVAMPKNWRRVPSTRFRDYNCKFNEIGEVYISIGSGDIKSNAERWLKQFGDTREVVVSELEKLDVMGSKAVILEAEGTFAGMRGVTIEDAGLLGLLVETRGNLITVKMIGKKEEVQAQRENFIAFSKSIQWK
ncbi:hypothetical protein [Rubritalea profundi]|uniref:hypothetical protein n=1 Tax=Rubritalea profundi TaxID=1658618 RepID=UPI0013FD8F2F|nr:hypothetical protein [Rubritalea profundi]